MENTTQTKLPKIVISILGVLAIILVSLLLLRIYPDSKTKTSDIDGSVATSGTKMIAHAEYLCDNNKTITATYYEGPAVAQPQKDQPPIPTGSVAVSFDTDPTVYTLAQTLSADGARYANKDESLVFWSKGDGALVMRNNTMDHAYTNCVTSPATE